MQTNVVLVASNKVGIKEIIRKFGKFIKGKDLELNK